MSRGPWNLFGKYDFSYCLRVASFLFVFGECVTYREGELGRADLMIVVLIVTYFLIFIEKVDYLKCLTKL